MAALDRREFLLRAGAAALAAGTSFGWELVGARAQGGRTQRRLRELARELRGPLLTPSRPGYTRAARLYNQRFDGTRPLAVAACASTADVQRCVRWAAKYDVRVAARSGGHSYAGYSTTTGLVIDLSGLDSIRLEPGGKTATIGPGAQLIDVYAGLARRGVTIPAGSCPSVGIGGLALGGGIGLAARKLGMTSDNIAAVEIVTADGRVLSCDADTNEDLYWACRGGGGGNFGVVTRFRFRTHRVRRAAYYFARWPWAAAEDAIAAWQAFAPEAPDELTSILNVSSGPSITSGGQFFGSAGELSRLLGPLRRSGASVSTGSSSYLALQKRWAGCADIGLAQCHTRGESAGGTLSRATFAGKSDYFSKPLSGAGRRAIARFIERRGGQSGSGAFILDSYGGRINDVKPDATAFVHRDQLFSAQYLAYWGGGAGATGQSLGWIRSFRSAMQRYASGFAYQNYIDPDLRGWKKAYYGSNYSRLSRVKERYDPDNLFRFKQSIPPSG